METLIIISVLTNFIVGAIAFQQDRFVWGFSHCLVAIATLFLLI